MSSTMAAPDGGQRRLIRSRVASLVQALHREYGEADLGNLEDPIDELVYISLTRQTHWQNASRSWRAVAGVGGARQLLGLEESRLARLLQPGGFARQKARWIKQSLEIIRDTMGELSLARAEAWSNEELERFLCSLPGISIKSAKCIMLYSMGRQVFPVDTHVRRVATRFGLVREGLSESRIHDALESIVPRRDHRSLHVNAIWHGRRVCRAQNPYCSQCVVRTFCAFANSGKPTATGAAA